MGKRHEAIGIKQAIRFEWMQKAANLLLAGLDAKTIRQELHEFLADRKGNGSEGERSDQTRTFVVNNLMKIWVSPDPELIPFRDASLAFLRENPSMALAVHWGMISAVYPFWFNVARQTGRLLALQDQVTQTQIINRLKEQYGDRQTVSRYSRFTAVIGNAGNAGRFLAQLKHEGYSIHAVSRCSIILQINGCRLAFFHYLTLCIISSV